MTENGTPNVDDETPETFERGCGVSFDHDTVDTYRGEDGVGWECRRCGAEGWEPAETEETK